jgi:outer membrane biogenesis lipoprotein LolB
MEIKIKSLLVLVLASLVLAGCCTMHSKKTTQWEYTTVEMVPLSSNDKTLNGYGKDGWTLVSVTPLKQDGGVGECAYVFKRLKH